MCVPCVWQPYENSLKNKDNTCGVKWPKSPDLASYSREEKSLRLHKYLKPFGMAFTTQSPAMLWSPKVSGWPLALRKLQLHSASSVTYAPSSPDLEVSWPVLGGSFGYSQGAPLRRHPNQCNWSPRRSGWSCARRGLLIWHFQHRYPTFLYRSHGYIGRLFLDSGQAHPRVLELYNLKNKYRIQVTIKKNVKKTVVLVHWLKKKIYSQRCAELSVLFLSHVWNLFWFCNIPSSAQKLLPGFVLRDHLWQAQRTTWDA